MPLNEIISTAAKSGAAIAIIPGLRMCHDCAFKHGTDANNDEDAVDAAMECLIGVHNTKFYCHRVEDGQFICMGPCAGFVYAKQYYDKMDKELDAIDEKDLQEENEIF